MLQIDGKKPWAGIKMLVAGHPCPSQPNALLSLDIQFGSRQDALHERSCSTPSLGQEEAVMSRNSNRETEFIPAVQARMPRARVSWSTISGPLTLVAIATDLPLNRAEIQMVDGLGDHPIDQFSEECADHLNGLLFGDHAEGTMQLCQLVKAKTQNGKLLDIIVLLEPSQKFSVLCLARRFLWARRSRPRAKLYMPRCGRYAPSALWRTPLSSCSLNPKKNSSRTSTCNRSWPNPVHRTSNSRLRRMLPVRRPPSFGVTNHETHLSESDALA